MKRERERVVTEHFDVAVVGYGPIGMACAALLGRQGHSVVVLERYSGLYGLPRAAIFDDETMRTFARLDVTPGLLPKIHASTNYEWRNAAGELLIEHAFSLRGRSAWAEWYEMYQPDLEDELDRSARASGNVEVRFDSTVTGYEQDADTATVQLADGTSVMASYVIAADGGNGMTRGALGVQLSDFGFSEPWMVCDFELRAPLDIPRAMQICDPAQPVSVISLGPRHHRFSFMLDSEGDFESQRAPEKVWDRVSRWMTRDQGTLIRVATYVFRSLIADRWRHGRIILAGDSAHKMPPFLGQGMCSGIRDAQNLAYRLDLILRGRAGDSLLDGYQSEREPHVEAVVLRGIELGRVQTMRDPEAAAARDRALIADREARRRPEKLRFPGIGPGLIGSTAAAGHLSPQGDVTVAGRRGRFDELLGYGLAVIGAPDAPTLSAEGVERIAASADLLVQFDGTVTDVEGVYAAWFRELAASYVVVRPDFYVYDAAADEASLLAVLDRYEAQLAGSRSNTVSLA
jgi:2-polyprenyl-6-methoxyphenol hydroxylase-like FAD-dependent oxidoreductase